MADDNDAYGRQFKTLLDKQMAQLKTAKAYKGQKPPNSMRRSRQQLEHEFTMIVWLPPLMNFLHQLHQSKILMLGFLGIP